MYIFKGIDSSTLSSESAIRNKGLVNQVCALIDVTIEAINVFNNMNWKCILEKGYRAA